MGKGRHSKRCGEVCGYMKREWKYLLEGVIALLFFGAVAGAVWKLNVKINNLYEVVQQQQNSQGAMNRAAYMPNLNPGTEGWLITQFGDPMQQQEMCYVITTATGLVIIDGGLSYEAPRLREIIGQYGDSVEAWIITHCHPDHITAFLDILEEPRDIKIHHIYTVEQADLALMEEKAPWDDFSMLNRFHALEIEGLEFLHQGDQLEIMGMKMEVLSAYDTRLNSMTNDLMNDGSLMFRLSGREESMLFCADVGTSLTDYLIDEYGESLKSDYIQMGHHGFGGLDEEFYRLVDPKAAFFDAPDWLVNEEGDRSTQEKEALMREMGCVIFSYYTAPNQILLK